MRLAIIATTLATAFMMTGASGQGAAKMNISGTKAFCAWNAGKANCNFDNAAACEKEIANMGADGKGLQCSPRSNLK